MGLRELVTVVIAVVFVGVIAVVVGGAGGA
jgi:hypothetical protein